MPACNTPHAITKRLAARDELHKGYEDYTKNQFDDAYCHFLRATELDPSLLMAKRYLGFALAQKVVPDLGTPENLAVARQAKTIFQQVLDKDPHDVNSMKQIAAIEYSIINLDEAREWQKRVLVEDAMDAEAAYTIGVIDWSQAHQNALKALQASGLCDDGEGNAHAPPDVLSRIREQNTALVEDGLRNLQLAIANRPDYDDAMAYLDLLYRRKADLDFEDPKARNQDVAVAGEWAQKAAEVHKANASKGARDAGSPQR